MAIQKKIMILIININYNNNLNIKINIKLLNKVNHNKVNPNKMKFLIKIMKITKKNIIKIKIKRIKFRMKSINIKNKWPNRELINFSKFNREVLKTKNMVMFRKKTMIFLEIIKMLIRVKEVDNKEKLVKSTLEIIMTDGKLLTMLNLRSDKNAYNILILIKLLFFLYFMINIFINFYF